jgi:hypothetical protein
MTDQNANLWFEGDAAVPPGRAALFLDRDGEPESANRSWSPSAAGLRRQRLAAISAGNIGEVQEFVVEHGVKYTYPGFARQRVAVRLDSIENRNT